jgi:hypothetical protein
MGGAPKRDRVPQTICTITPREFDIFRLIAAYNIQHHHDNDDVIACRRHNMNF